MLTDRYDLPVSTTSSAAWNGCVEGCEAKLTMYPGAFDAFDRAIAAGRSREAISLSIRSLRRAPEEPDDTCWLGGEGWWLSTVPVPKPSLRSWNQSNTFNAGQSSSRPKLDFEQSCIRAERIPRGGSCPAAARGGPRFRSLAPSRKCGCFKWMGRDFRTAFLERDREFESTSLQRRVSNEPSGGGEGGRRVSPTGGLGSHRPRGCPLA